MSLVEEVEQLKKLVERMGVVETPLTTWANWTPTLTGWSVVPPNSTYRYIVIGKLCIVNVRQGSGSTSDTTGITITAPFAAAANGGVYIDYAQDKGAEVTDNCRASILSGSSNIVCLKGGSVTGWTASGAKRVWFTMMYEIG